MCYWFCLLCIYGVLADFEQVIVPVLLFLALLLIRHSFVQCEQHLYIGVILQYNSGSMAAVFEQVTLSILLFFTWVLCIYIILDKGCHILYIFGLNNMVWSHIVGVRLSSDQVTYDLIWRLTCIIVFHCVCISKVSSNLQCLLVYVLYSCSIWYVSLV